MKNKGFTLIELLAVIVILAIIALIATPIVLSIISDSKESSNLRSAEMYLDAIEYAIANKILNNEKIEDATYSIMDDGNICLGILNDTTCTGDILEVEVNGEVPEKYSSVTIKDGKLSKINFMYEGRVITNINDTNLEYETLGVAELEKAINKVYNKDIKIGDYVNYDETKGGTVTVEKDVKWRVLGIEDGQLLLVSETNIIDEFTMSGTDQNWIGKVNESCLPYGKGLYVDEVRSINVDDVNRVTGYNPDRSGTGAPYHLGRITQYLNKVTYKFGTDANGNKVILYESVVNPGKYNSQFNTQYCNFPNGVTLSTEDNPANKQYKEITITSNYYWYNPEVLKNIDPNDSADVEEYNNSPKIGVAKGTPGYNMLFSNTTKDAGAYWLASEFTYTEHNSWPNPVFGLRTVVDNKVGYANYYLWYSTLESSSHTETFGIRAVVKLSNNIKLTKDSSNVWNIEQK